MKYSRRRYSFVPALLSAALLVSAYPGAALANGETGVYLDGAQAESYDAALAAAAADSAEHTVTVYSDAETALRNEFVTGNTVTIRNGDDKATVTQTGQNNISLLIASGQEPTVNLGKEELEATGEEAALVFNAGANRSFMELNGGTVNLYNGTVIGEGGHYIFTPAYSPENAPSDADYNKPGCVAANTAMDIAAARDSVRMYWRLAERDVITDINEARLCLFEERIPPYMYNERGAVKEWSLSMFGDHDNHRHSSHLYAAWPGFDAAHDKTVADLR